LYLNNEIPIKRELINLDNIFKAKTEYEMDFCNVKGQSMVKRALEVAAARRTQYFMYSERLGSRKNNDGKVFTINTSRLKYGRSTRSYKNT